MYVLSVILLLLGVSVSSSLPAIKSDNISRIVNGQAIDISAVPYHGAIWRTSSGGWAYTCGTAIITTRALLTAAHCVKSVESNPSAIRVTVGTSYRLYGGDVYKISKIYVHKNYSSLTLQDDIAMLITSKKMSFGKNVDAVFIPNANYNVPVNKSALVSGFGTTSYLGPTPSVLLAATVNVVSQEECTRAYRSIAMVTSRMICASANNPPKDACQGDSGGPLVTDNTLIGIVSFGEGCADTTYPGVYTRVSEYYSWILSNLALI